MTVGRAAVFLDKDGTLVDDVPYNVDPALIRLADGAVEGLALLHVTGFPMLVISNQSGVARGLFAEEALAAVEARLRALLADAGVPLAGFYYCPHHPDGSVAAYAVSCECRKPRPGLLVRAAREHGIDLARSWFIGDILHDVEAGHRAGCRAVMLDNGHETEWELSPLRTPDVVARDLAEAAREIVGLTPTQPSPIEGEGWKPSPGARRAPLAPSPLPRPFPLPRPVPAPPPLPPFPLDGGRGRGMGVTP